MDAKQIIMSYSTPPGLDDFEVLAETILQGMPDELLGYCDNISLSVEDFPDDTVQADLDLEDPYELLALYKSGRELSPGVEKKTIDSDDLLILYRRPILDVWCENCDDITLLIRSVMIEEIAKAFDFSEDDIDEMTSRHHQQLL